MGTFRFKNDHFAAITGYGDYVHGNVTICHVYYIEGLGHNLFSVGQFCDGDLEVAFRSKTCYVRNLGGDDLLTSARDSNFYTISISDTPASSPTPYGLLKNRKPDVQYFHVFGSLCCPTNDRDDLAKMKPKADIGIFIGYFQSLRGCLEPENNRFNVEDSLDEYNQTPSKEDLNDLFGPLYEEYC
ncbi:hypothetical protein Tco_0379653 [Tanacetum coccineum]